MISRHHRRSNNLATPELDVTPFMNLMIVLVPVLLLSLVFTHTTVIELNFPSGEALANLQAEQVHLEVRIEPDALIVADGRSIIRKLPVGSDGQHDLAGLQAVMIELKRRMPDKTDVLVLCRDETAYQDLVLVMDGVRGRVLGAQGEKTEATFMPLFPDISLGDAPVEETS